MPRTPRASSSPSAPPQADTPGNAEFVARVQREVRGLPPEDAADAYAAAQVHAGRGEAVGSIDDQAKLADWLRANKVDTILGPLRWDEDRRPKGDFLTGQWQNGKAEFVLPQDVATTDQDEMGWQPGEQGS